MAQQSLTEYISKLLKSGYDVGTIRTTLINAGYSLSEINQALTYIKKPTRKIFLNLKVILVAISALILIVLLVLGGIMLLSPEPKTVDFRLSAIQTEIKPGENLAFLTTFTSNTDAQENININYEIINIQTKELFTSKQEIITIGQRSGLTKNIAMPADTIPGKYELIATMKHKDEKQSQTINFDVLEKTTGMPSGKEIEAETFEEEIIQEEIKCPESCDDFNPCTIDYCDKGVCKHTPIKPCCGNGLCEPGETISTCREDCAKIVTTPTDLIEQAKKVARTDPEAASALCNQLIQPNNIDLCFIEISQESGQSRVCENVKTQGNKDSCYMNFALKGDYSICSKVQDSYLSKSCYSLKRSNNILTQIEQTE